MDQPGWEQNNMQESGSSGVAQSEGSIQGNTIVPQNLIINRALIGDWILPADHHIKQSTKMFYGPVEPPSFLWEKAAKVIIPQVLEAIIPYSLNPLPLCW